MPHPAALFAVAARRPLAPDADLLAAWATARDADAFAELVRRYGPLVWRVCRGTAGNSPAAEDAFQATFFALSRGAGRVTVVAGFLHRTARRAAWRAARRDRRLSLPSPPPSPDPLDRLTARELLAAVDSEIARLPERQRLPLLLCGVDGLATDEAARRLGWTAGAVRGGLQRGRERLRSRLAARGLAVPAVLGACVVPERLTAAVRAGGPIPAAVANLVPGGLAMKLWACTGVVAVGLAAAGWGGAGQPPADQPSKAKPPEPAVEKPRLTDPADWSVPTHDATGKWVRVFHSAVWTPDGKTVLVVQGDSADPVYRCVVQAFDAANGKPGLAYRGDATNYVNNHQSVAVSRDGKTLAACGDVFKRRADGTIVSDDRAAVEVWDVGTPNARLRLPLPSRGAGVGFTADGKTVVAACRSAVIGWDVTTGRERFRHPTPPTGALAVHPSGLLAVGLEATPGQVRLIDAATGETRAEAETGGEGVCELAFDAAGGLLAAGGTAGKSARLVARAWTVADGRLTADRAITGESVWFSNLGVAGLAFAPVGADRRWLAVLGEDGVVRFYDPATGELKYVFPGHQGRGRSVAYSPDGRKLLTAGSDRLAVWDLAAVEAWRPPHYYR